jgi:hypothetical protein
LGEPGADVYPGILLGRILGREVCDVDPMVYPKCGGPMKVIAFITQFRAVDRIIDHLKLKFMAAKPLPSHVFKQVALMASFRGKAGFPHMSKPCLHEERSAFSVFDSYIASCYA